MFLGAVVEKYLVARYILLGIKLLFVIIVDLRFYAAINKALRKSASLKWVRKKGVTGP